MFDTFRPSGPAMWFCESLAFDLFVQHADINNDGPVQDCIIFSVLSTEILQYSWRHRYVSTDLKFSSEGQIKKIVIDVFHFIQNIATENVMYK